MKNNFKYIKNVDKQLNEATILLYGPIGNYIDEEENEICGINGTAFANEMLYLESQVDKITVRINSIGGSVLDGYSIIAAIQSSNAEVITVNDGLAASIAGVILCVGQKRMAYDYSILMLHNPSGGEDQEVLNKIKESLVTILSVTSISLMDDINNLLDEETYFTAKEAKDRNFIDEIILSGTKVKVDTKDLNKMELVFNKLIKKQEMAIKKVKNSEEIETPTLEITETVETEVVNLTEVLATEEKIEVVAEVKADAVVDVAFEKLKSAFAELQTKYDALITETKEAHKTKIDATVNALVKAGKIKDTEKADAFSLFNANFEAATNMYNKIGAPTVSKFASISDAINVKSVENAVWTLERYWNENPTGLEEIKNLTPEVYSLMVQEYNNRKKNK